MIDDFVTFKIAIQLKDLNYQEESFTYYDHNGKLKEENIHATIGYKWQDLLYNKDVQCLAPTWEQVFSWFRKKGFFVQIYPDNQQFVKLAEKWFYVISKGTRTMNDEKLSTYEEARQACVEKLIEWIK